ncbi:hypothetical protein GCM10027517_28030 [Phycicoccus ginsengisoli]
MRWTAADAGFTLAVCGTTSLRGEGPAPELRPALPLVLRRRTASPQVNGVLTAPGGGPSERIGDGRGWTVRGRENAISAPRRHRATVSSSPNAKRARSSDHLIEVEGI